MIRTLILGIFLGLMFYAGAILQDLYRHTTQNNIEQTLEKR